MENGWISCTQLLVMVDSCGAVYNDDELVFCFCTMYTLYNGLCTHLWKRWLSATRLWRRWTCTTLSVEWEDMCYFFYLVKWTDVCESVEGMGKCHPVYLWNMTDRFFVLGNLL